MLVFFVLCAYAHRFMVLYLQQSNQTSKCYKIGQDNCQTSKICIVKPNHAILFRVSDQQN